MRRSTKLSPQLVFLAFTVPANVFIFNPAFFRFFWIWILLRWRMWVWRPEKWENSLKELSGTIQESSRRWHTDSGKGNIPKRCRDILKNDIQPNGMLLFVTVMQDVVFYILVSIAILLNIILLDVIVSNIIRMNVFFVGCYNDECHSLGRYLDYFNPTEWHSTECHSTECHSTECHSTECHSTECHSTECYSTECHSTEHPSKCPSIIVILLKVIICNVCLFKISF